MRCSQVPASIYADGDGFVLYTALTPEQVRIYDAYAGAFQVIHNNLAAAMQAANITGASGTLNRQAKSAARSAFDPARVHSPALLDQGLQWVVLSTHYRVVSLLPFVLLGVVLARLRLTPRVAGATLGLGLVAGLGVAISGDLQGKVMTEVQPMKMAAAEALYDTEDSCASFSILTIGTPDGEHEKFAITVPCVLSFLATGDVDGKVEGINQLQEEYAKVYGGSGDPLLEVRDYRPNIMVTYWSFRYMMGAGALGMLAAAGVAAVPSGAAQIGRLGGGAPAEPAPPGG